MAAVICIDVGACWHHRRIKGESNRRGFNENESGAVVRGSGSDGRRSSPYRINYRRPKHGSDRIFYNVGELAGMGTAAAKRTPFVINPGGTINVLELVTVTWQAEESWLRNVINVGASNERSV